MSADQSFTCPNCGTTFPYNAALLGKRVRCPACKQAFVVTETPSEPVAKAEPATKQAEDTDVIRPSSERIPSNERSEFSFAIQDEPVASARGSAQHRGATITDLLWALLDFRLEKYLTPYIIRLYWILAIVVALLYGLGIVFAVVLEGPASATQAVDPSQEAMRQLFGQPRQSTSERSELLVAYNRFKSIIIKTIGIMCLILAVRVWCELIIVVFNIANSLKSIDSRVGELGRERDKT